MRPLVLIASLLTLAASARPAGAQERAATERRLAALRTQIGGVERQIRQARSQETGALAAVEGLDAEVRLREELVAGYRAQRANFQAETVALGRAIGRLENEIEQARASYRRRARHAYVRGRISDLALILSSGSLTQAIARARYLRRFAQQRRRQVERITRKTGELRLREVQLAGSIRETQRLLTSSQVEQAELTERRRARSVLVEEARTRRTALERELAQRRADADQMEVIVRDLLTSERLRAEEDARRAEETRRLREAEAAARRAAEEERLAEEQRRREPPRFVEPRRSPTPRGRLNTRTTPEPSPASPPRTAAAPAADRPAPEGGASEGSFRSNRGRLRWPADGTVTGAFGMRTDPVYGTRIESPGIDIATAPRAPVRAVFSGTVERVGAMATYGTYVMVSHGAFTTIYGNLSYVDVSQGQRVTAGQGIGSAGTAEQRRGAALFFALFDGETPVDPLGWLRGR